MNFQVCSDIGGTFTDVYIRNDDGDTRSIKSPTTSSELTEGLFNAIGKAAEEFDHSVEELLTNTDRLIHGTTVATNAIIENDTAKTALICTEGFRDTLTLREGGKENPYDWDADYPDPYIPRKLTFGVEERITSEGEVHIELDEEQCQEVVREVVDRDVEAIAVSLLWSHQNSDHEERIGALIEEEAPDLHYSLSSDIAPIIREYRRTSATAINASLHGIVSEYLNKLAEKLESYQFTGTPLIITANGGVMQIDEILRAPIWMVDSGPTMFPVASRNITQAELGRDDIIALDMGGTSLDMGVVNQGNISRSREAKVEGDHQLGIEKVEIKSIGSGGGSIAWVDPGGLLHVGPQSAGAEPGPACYMQGGAEPTVTDAALVLGYLNVDYFLGGEMEVSRDAAVDVLETKIGENLGLDAIEAAHAVYATANQNIVSGVKSVTIERGINPRKFVLSGGGGALGSHVVPVARELEIDDILLPREAGVVSAVGGLVSDIRRDFSESHFTSVEDFDYDRVNSVLAELESKASAFFDRAKVPEAQRSRQFFTEGRYPNQVWELEVPLPFSRIDDGGANVLADQFHQIHDDTYGFKIEEQDVELLQWRVEAVGGNPESNTLYQTATKASSGVESAIASERTAYFDREEYTCPAYRANELWAGHSLKGPGFVEADTTTVVLPPGCDLTVTDLGNYHIQP